MPLASDCRNGGAQISGYHRPPREVALQSGLLQTRTGGGEKRVAVLLIFG
jgi:hypothetical protein